MIKHKNMIQNRKKISLFLRITTLFNQNTVLDTKV